VQEVIDLNQPQRAYVCNTKQVKYPEKAFDLSCYRWALKLKGQKSHLIVLSCPICLNHLH